MNAQKNIYTWFAPKAAGGGAAAPEAGALPPPPPPSPAEFSVWFSAALTKYPVAACLIFVLASLAHLM